MRRYIITLLILAFLIGSLFKAADQTGVRLMRMFGTIGIFLFGVVGTMALTRWQSRAGLKEIQDALKTLEPGFLITDWAFSGGLRPDYLVVAPGGLIAVCVEEVPQGTGPKRASARIAKGRAQVQTAVRWLRDRLNEAGSEVRAPLGGFVQELSVDAVLVLSRRLANPDDTADGVTVLNAGDLANHVRSVGNRPVLDEQARVRLTRLFRQ